VQDSTVASVTCRAWESLLICSARSQEQTLAHLPRRT
jgi:hypothetical protein